MSAWRGGSGLVSNLDQRSCCTSGPVSNGIVNHLRRVNHLGMCSGGGSKFESEGAHGERGRGLGSEASLKLKGF